MKITDERAPLTVTEPGQKVTATVTRNYAWRRGEDGPVVRAKFYAGEPLAMLHALQLTRLDGGAWRATGHGLRVLKSGAAGTQCVEVGWSSRSSRVPAWLRALVADLPHVRVEVES